MKRAVMLSAVAAVLVSVGVGAQGRNFSGTWVVDQEKTAAAGGGAVGGGGAVVARSGDRAIATAGGGGGGGVAVAAGGGGARAVAGVASGLSLAMDANAFTVVNGATTTTYKLDG